MVADDLSIVFLGTGTSQGVPIIGSTHPVCLSKNPKDKRRRSSVLLKWGTHSFVIDCGPDFRQQMLDAGVKSLDGIILTHEHADHTAGLDDIRPFSNANGPLPVYTYKRVFENIKRRFFYIFDDNCRYPGRPQIISHYIDDTPFSLAGKRVIPIRVNHGKLAILGYRIDDFAYITDAKTIDDGELEKLKSLDVLVVNTLRIEPHHTHFSLEESLNFAAKVNPKRVYLIHMSHLLGFHDEVENTLPLNVKLAYDSLVVESLHKNSSK